LKVCAIKGKSFSCTNWTSVTQVDISGLSHLLAYRARVADRPAVIAAMQAEGLT
jgi:glutathione S-transferase